MSINHNENLLRQLIGAENSHDIERFILLVTDDVVIEDMPLGAVMKGKDGVRQGYVGFLKITPDFKIELKSWICLRFCP
jgi:ketosteroid isomerase-like protein